ncbi:NDUFA3 isoform 7 [Pan troglodytes]|uniref:NADH:ubiquinone oxidoreductase subunit A3 n=2 Tax=Homininae TaxID=207598 RepID=A8MUI2_HUMAN|nr:NADH:ubiquinone oxidoreductase subunit A3 [Homo sapiens]KAI4044673.1 NADH:ubiquinone oxidoreductase subunit A3 [Homo sapiens]PNI92310.1 NDUFA3 isoform 7 [Pan troglodytes]
MAASKCRSRRLPQECLGQGASAGRVLRRRGPRCNSAPIEPLLQVLRHDQQGHALQLPSARP